MSKNQFIKKLLVAGLCALTATATVGAVACKSNNPGSEKPPIEQTEGTEYTVTFSHGNVMDDTTTKVEDGEKVSAPTSYVKDTEYSIGGNKYVFGGWYADALFKTEFDFNTAITGATTVYAKWLQWVTIEVDHGAAQTYFDLADKSKTEADSTYGRITYEKGLYFESDYDGGGLTGSIINTQSVGFYVELAGSGTISFSARTTSTGKESVVSISSVDGEGQKTSIGTVGTVNSDGKATEIKTGTLEAGLYYFSFSYTVRMGAITIVELVPVAEVTGIEVEGATDVFLQGTTFDSKGLTVTAVSANGARQLVTTGYEVDNKNVDMSKAGKYTVTVKYGDFTDDYEITVYAAQGLTLGFNATKAGSSTSYGNGTYVNQTVQQVYFKGDTLSKTGLTVSVDGEYEGDKQSFITTEYDCEIEGEEGLVFTTAGEKVVTVNFNGDQLQKTFTVNVIDITADTYAGIEDAEEVDLIVAPANTFSGNYSVGDKINELDQEGIYFNTIQQALDFLGLLKLGDNVKKTIHLVSGTYKEKLEITIPNLSIVGEVPDGEDKPVIEWDSLYGIPDESGFVQLTDSTATLNVRESATGFSIKNVTVSNYWNSVERFNKLGENYGEHRALAILIQADKVVIEDCELLGYQDTIELFTGRQIIRNTLITGTTDFIFGTNNTTLFEGCEIRSINTGKTDGGYITAFKGYNKDGKDAVTYGAIFYNCKFTAETGVATGNTSIGRPWGEYAAVAVIKSELGGHISTEGYDGSSTKNLRYVGGLSSVANPNTSTVKFVEYGNEGAGSIKEEVAGMKMLTAEEAEKYHDLSVIFGEDNGYSDSWDGTIGVEITSKTYSLGDLKDDESSIGAVSISGTHRNNTDSIQVKANDTVITMTEQGKITVDWYGGEYGSENNGKITYKDGYATLTIVDDAASTGGIYIKSIKLDTTVIPDDTPITEEVPEEVVSPNLTYNFNDLTATSGTGTESDPAEFFNSKVSLVGKYGIQGGNGIQVFNKSEFTVYVGSSGKVILSWYPNFSGDDYVTITYDYEHEVAKVVIDNGTEDTSSYYLVSIGVISEVISEKHTWDFNGGTEGCLDVSAAGKAITVDGLLVMSGKDSFASNNGNWFSVPNETKFVLNVKAGLTVQLVVYSASAFSMQVGDEDPTTCTLEDHSSGNKAINFTAEEDTIVTFIASGSNTFVRYIYVLEN